jgi:UDP-2-acetamido-2,6-beta-L-arabino-hexul-4-ose reductase
MTQRVVVTGADGFLGWHLRCRFHAFGGNQEVVALGRNARGDHNTWADAVRNADVVIHLAGVNRGAEREVTAGNASAARDLIQACEASGASPDIVFANSIRTGEDSAYGEGKLVAAHVLEAWTDRRGRRFCDVRLPNLFGEHGRPYYNSVVATFCELVASGGTPEVLADAEIPLLHAQSAADVLIRAACPTGVEGVLEVGGRMTRVTALRDLITEQARIYALGDIPDLLEPFARDVFNTYRSYAFPSSHPLSLVKHVDARGSLFECVRAHGGQGQTFVSTSAPGVTRGEHFHLQKVERFIVIAGKGTIRLRRLLTDEVVSFDVDAECPVAIDMPTLWAHSITNVGDHELVTLFWASELFERDRSDTYPEPVVREVIAS